MIEIKAKQPRVYHMLSQAIEKNKLVHAYLFDGPKGVGKYQAALWLAQCYFCDNAILACGTCHNCLRIEGQNHPDVHVVEPDGQSLKIEQMLGIKQHLGKSGLEQAKQFLIVKEADKMTIQAANSLLKFIEEPTGPLKIVFITENKERVLPTIQSRCQLVHFDQISVSELKNQLNAQGISPQLVDLLANLTNDVTTAQALAEEPFFTELKEALDKWWGYLLKKDPYAFVFVQQHLVKLCKDKAQQNSLFDLLIAYAEIFLSDSHSRIKGQENWSKQRLAAVTQELLDAKQRWRANVAFQVTLEQVALSILKK